MRKPNETLINVMTAEFIQWWNELRFPERAWRTTFCELESKLPLSKVENADYQDIFQTRFEKVVSREVLEVLKAFSSVPQGVLLEDKLQYCEDRNWRRYFASKLWGEGLEIGPLHRPMFRHDGMQLKYIDRFSVEHLREHYPELKGLELVAPDIIGNAETMDGIESNSFDFLIAAHVIEHVKNPISSIREWCRIVRPGGSIYLVVPDKRITFDNKRVRTTPEHMILDFLAPSSERDFEHYLDYAINVHDTFGADAIEEAKRLIETDYSIHYHVFLPTDMVQLINWINENVTSVSIKEGPALSPGSDEFHLLLRVNE